MARCVDCHWFHSPVEFGREKRSCEDLGESPSNKACTNFVDRLHDGRPHEGDIDPSIPNKFNAARRKAEGYPEPNRVPTVTPKNFNIPPDAKKILTQLGALSDMKYRDIFHEVLAESFTLEQDSELALKTIQAQLQTQGAEVVLEGFAYQRYASRLAELWTLHRLILAMGLAPYLDQIMAAEIEYRFKPPRKEKQ